MAQLVPSSSVPAIPLPHYEKLDVVAAIGALTVLGAEHERFVVRLHELVARIALLDATRPDLADVLRENAFWNVDLGVGELRGTLHAVECGIREIDVCLHIGTTQGLDALLEALGYEED